MILKKKSLNKTFQATTTSKDPYWTTIMILINNSLWTILTHIQTRFWLCSKTHKNLTNSIKPNMLLPSNNSHKILQYFRTYLFPATPSNKPLSQLDSLIIALEHKRWKISNTNKTLVKKRFERVALEDIIKFRFFAFYVK